MFEKLLSITDATMRVLHKFYFRQYYEKKKGDVVLPVTPLRQTMSYTCGTVAMITVKTKLSPASISKLMQMKDGITVNTIMRYMRQHKKPFVHLTTKLSFYRIKKYIDAGNAIITTTNHGGGHWATIIGYYDEGVIMAGCNKYRYTWKEFRSKNIAGAVEDSLLVMVK